MTATNYGEILEMMRNINAVLADCKERAKAEMHMIVSASEFKRKNNDDMLGIDLIEKKIIIHGEDVL